MKECWTFRISARKCLFVRYVSMENPHRLFSIFFKKKKSVIWILLVQFLVVVWPKYPSLTGNPVRVYVNTFANHIRNRYQLVISYVNGKHIGNKSSKMLTLFKWYEAISMQKLHSISTRNLYLLNGSTVKKDIIQSVCFPFLPICCFFLSRRTSFATNWNVISF